eukprot:s978_g7.t2
MVKRKRSSSYSSSSDSYSSDSRSRSKDRKAKPPAKKKGPSPKKKRAPSVSEKRPPPKKGTEKPKKEVKKEEKPVKKKDVKEKAVRKETPPKTTRTEKAGKSKPKERSRTPPRKKAPAPRNRMRSEEDYSEDDRGDRKSSRKTGQPQARSFLGALAAVKKASKDMKPAKEYERKNDGAKSRSLMCGHPECQLIVHSDPSISDQFCCGKCKAAFYANPQERPSHGKKCEQQRAQKDAERAKPPKEESADGSGDAWKSWGNQNWKGGKSWNNWQGNNKWSNWKKPEVVEESKESTVGRGMRAWSDDEEDKKEKQALKERKGSKASKDKDGEDKKDEANGKDGKDNSDWSNWSGWKGGGGGNSWNKSDWKSNWKSQQNQKWKDWKSDGDSGWKKQKGSGEGSLDAAKPEESPEELERRQKRAARFESNAVAKPSASMTCKIEWSATSEKEKDEDAGEAAGDTGEGEERKTETEDAAKAADETTSSAFPGAEPDRLNSVNHA